MVWINDFKRMEPGDIVAVDAVDWALYSPQSTVDEEYKIVRGLLYGEVVKYVSGGEGVLITSQRFECGDIRGSMAIPISAIRSVRVLASRREMQQRKHNQVEP